MLTDATWIGQTCRSNTCTSDHLNIVNFVGANVNSFAHLRLFQGITQMSYSCTRVAGDIYSSRPETGKILIYSLALKHLKTHWKPGGYEANIKKWHWQQPNFKKVTLTTNNFPRSDISINQKKNMLLWVSFAIWQSKRYIYHEAKVESNVVSDMRKVIKEK